MKGKFGIVMSLVVANAAIAEEKLVYESRWTKPNQPLGKEWSSVSGWVQTTPNGARTLLGSLREKGASLAIKGLPAHQVVHVEFDLIIRGSWDGTPDRGNLDRVEVKLKDGRTLLSSTFRTYGWYQNPQSYPFSHDSGIRTPTHFGASEQGTLGYRFAMPVDDKYAADSVYHLDWYIPHAGDEFEMQIRTRLGEDDKGQTMWVGVDQMKVSVQAAGEEIPEEEWSGLVADMMSGDPLAANRACWEMLRSPAQARGWLAGKAVLPDGDEARAVAALGDESLEKRVAAAEVLLRLPSEVLPKLRASLENVGEPATKRRLQRIIGAIEAGSRRTGDSYWRARLWNLLNPGDEIIDGEEGTP